MWYLGAPESALWVRPRVAGMAGWLDGWMAGRLDGWRRQASAPAAEFWGRPGWAVPEPWGNRGHARERVERLSVDAAVEVVEVVEVVDDGVVNGRRQRRA